MKSYAYFLYAAAFLMLGDLSAFAGSTTLTTYYPAPDGNYNKLTSNNVGIGQATGADVLDITGNTVDIGNVTATNVTATGTVSSTGGSAATTTAQGAYLYWNLSGGTGETDFINNEGLGSGGFSFQNTPAIGSPKTTLATISGAGITTITGTAGAGTPTLLVNGRIESGDGSGDGGMWVDNPPTRFVGADGATIGLYNAGWGLTLGNTGAVDVPGNTTLGTNSANTETLNGIVTVNGVGATNQDFNVNGRITTGYPGAGTGGVWVGTNEFLGSYDANNIMIWNNTHYLLFDDLGNLTVPGNLTVSGTLITTPGNITATGAASTIGTPNNPPSDARLKKNIVPLRDTLSTIDQLRGVSYRWNHLAGTMGYKEGEKHIGMIAQELQKVYPDLVGSFKSGKVEYLNIDYAKFTAVLLESVKELKSQMDGMQGQIDALQEKVKMLEKQK